MPSKPASEPSAIAAARARIREAEKGMGAGGRETVGIDIESYEMLATLVERKVGRRTEVLRLALATGLRVLLRGDDRTTASPSPALSGFGYEEIPEGAETEREPDVTDPIVRAALGMGALPPEAFAQSGTTPPEASNAYAIEE